MMELMVILIKNQLKLMTTIDIHLTQYILLFLIVYVYFAYLIYIFVSFSMHKHIY